MSTLIIDNVGFDIEAMKRMNEKDFINLHLENKSIAQRMAAMDRRKYLKDAYRMIKGEESAYAEPERQEEKEED